MFTSCNKYVWQYSPPLPSCAVRGANNGYEYSNNNNNTSKHSNNTTITTTNNNIDNNNKPYNTN